MIIDLGQVVVQMVVMLLIVSAGYAARRFQWLEPAADAVFSQTVVRLTAPCLVFYGILVSRDKLFTGNLPLIALAVGAAVLLAGVMAFFVFRIGQIRSDHRSVLQVATMFGNVSFLGIPLCYGLFGADGLLYASLYAASQDLLFWSVGVAMMGGSGTAGNWKKMFNPSFIGILLAILLAAWRVPVPEFVLKTTSTIGAATLPLSLMVVGAGFCGAKAEWVILRKLLPAAGMKLVVVPMAMTALLFLLPMDPVSRCVLALEMSMPSAASTVALARTMGRDTGFAAQAVLMTTTLSAVSVPLMVLALNRFAI